MSGPTVTRWELRDLRRTIEEIELRIIVNVAIWREHEREGERLAPLTTPQLLARLRDLDDERQKAVAAADRAVEELRTRRERVLREEQVRKLAPARRRARAAG